MKQPKTYGLVIAMLAAAARANAVTVIDFEDWSGSGDVQVEVQSHGYSFANSFTVSVEPQTGNPTYALHGLLSGAKFTNGVSRFSITSLDLQEGLGATSTSSIKLVGYRLPLPEVVQTFTLDGFSDTFETFHPIGFSEISMAFLYAYDAQGQPTPGFSVDNIAVPEPGVLSLSLLAAAAMTRRKSPV